jgi:hypothetical protein
MHIPIFFRNWPTMGKSKKVYNISKPYSVDYVGTLDEVVVEERNWEITFTKPERKDS